MSTTPSPGRYPDPDEGASDPWWRRPWAFGAAAAILALAIGAFAVLTLTGDAEAEIILEPTQASGADPFTTSVVLEEVEVAGGGLEAVSGEGESVESVSGAAPGLYGGTGAETVCDAEALASFLDQNPDKAAAFGAVVGVDRREVADYITGLTPVLLREDTRVTNHGFVDGQADPFDAVLQAGTAVMVDSRGVPRVRCACGNPLAEPATTASGHSYSGEAWDGFDSDRLIAVAAADKELERLEVVNVHTGERYEQAVGARGDVRELIFDFSGVGSLRIGVSAEEAQKATGLEVTISRPDGIVTDCFFIEIPELNLGGISLDGETVGSLFAPYDSSRSGNPPRTQEGITIGSTVSELEEAHPDVHREPATQNPLYEIARVERDGEIMQFSVDEENRVRSISTGRSPEVGYLCT